MHVCVFLDYVFMYLYLCALGPSKCNDLPFCMITTTRSMSMIEGTLEQGCSHGYSRYDHDRTTYSHITNIIDYFSGKHIPPFVLAMLVFSFSFFLTLSYFALDSG